MAQEKERILDEFVALTGYHRKHAIRVLNRAPDIRTVIKRGRPRLYDEGMRQSLTVLWEAADRICGKRLRPLVPVLLSALERHGPPTARRDSDGQHHLAGLVAGERLHVLQHRDDLDRF